MNISVDIDDALLREAQGLARARGISVDMLIEEALRTMFVRTVQEALGLDVDVDPEAPLGVTEELLGDAIRAFNNGREPEE